MFFICFNGSWQSAVASMGLSFIIFLLNYGGAFMEAWWKSRSAIRRKRDSMLLYAVATVATVLACSMLWLRKESLRLWWRRLCISLFEGEDPNREVDVDALVRRLHSLPIETWRPTQLLTNRELRRYLERLGLSTQLERNDAIDAIEERTEKTCAVCQEEFCDGEPLRYLRQCRHSYHVECIDKWVFVESGKGRLPKCPLCNAAL